LAGIIGPLYDVLKGTPHSAKIALTIASDRVREIV
jgi:hypothetical protein